MARDSPAIVLNVETYVPRTQPSGMINIVNIVNMVYNCSCHGAVYDPYVTH